MDKQRYYGVDLLRIISMFFIIILHIINHGGIINHASNLPFIVVTLIEVIAFCGVNIFALVSGFVGYRDDNFELKTSRFIKLWLEVLFYSILFALIFFLLHNNIAIKDLIKSVLPITTSQYWYFTSYSIVFLLSPLLNKIVYYSKKDTVNIITFIIIFLSFYSSIATKLGDPFKLSNGYSFVWLLALYLIGAFIKKYEVHKKIKNKKVFLIILSLLGITYLFKIGFNLVNINILENILLSYLSPTILGVSIGFLLIFSNINGNKVVNAIIKFFAPTTFGIYLIHDNPFIRKYIISNRFSFIAELDLLLIPLTVVIIALLIFISCGLIDKVRNKLFEILHIEIIIKYIEKLVCFIKNKFIKILKLNVYINEPDI